MMVNLRVWVIALIWFVCTGLLLANPLAPHWALIDQSAPSRYYLKSATDLNRMTVVVFGGIDSISQYPTDTWEWDDGWRQFQTSGPEGRIGHGMCYDFNHFSSLLFGGQNQAGEYLNDLWSWDGSTWILLQTGGPSPRAFFSFAYDPVSQRAVLFGGIDSTGVLSDTWEWDGTTWTERNISGPSARILSSMTYYDGNQSLLLFGGMSGIEGTCFNDTWSLSQSGWNEINCQRPPSARAGHVMIFDFGPSAALILFGGANNGIDSIYNDTWEFYYSDWESMDYLSIQPSPRENFEMCQRPWSMGEDGSVLLFGGRNDSVVFNQTWTYPVWRSYIIGDINNDGSYDGLDIVFGINYFKGGAQPPYSMWCYDSVWYVAGDVNGSCTFNGLDITYGVNYFKGGPAIHPCPACPE